MKLSPTRQISPGRGLAGLLCLLVAVAAKMAWGATDMAFFAPPPGAVPPAGDYSGTITLDTGRTLALEVVRDDFDMTADASLLLAQLPPFEIGYVQVGQDLVPTHRGLQRTAHPHWDLLLEPGRVWRDEGGGAPWASLPFALQEKNANCTHNGVLRLRLETAPAPARAQVLMASETCLYLKFNLQGTLGARFSRHPVDSATTIAAAHRALRARQLPTRPLAALAGEGGVLQTDAFAGGGSLPREDLSAWGLVVGDRHYTSDCPTRRGPYPFCDAMSLPSYSLAKSLVGGLGLMRLEQLHPGSRSRELAPLVPACNQQDWRGVTLEHTLNMLTGHYSDPAAEADENSSTMLEGFFLPRGHRAKVDFACNAWPRRAGPGERFAYHTSDTYLLGVAMASVLGEQRAPDPDLYSGLVLPLWQALGLSPALATTRRTSDDARQPFAGYGLTLLRDDVARIAQALNRDTLAPLLDRAMLDEALQRGVPDASRRPAQGALYYRHGFWAYDATRLLACEKTLLIPFLSGYGGINVLLLPGDRAYYYFGDSGRFAFTAALREIHRLRPLCQSAGQAATTRTTP